MPPFWLGEIDDQSTHDDPPGATGRKFSVSQNWFSINYLEMKKTIGHTA
jgi:hypothetical protein